MCHEDDVEIETLYRHGFSHHSLVAKFASLLGFITRKLDGYTEEDELTEKCHSQPTMKEICKLH